MRRRPGAHRAGSIVVFCDTSHLEQTCRGWSRASFAAQGRYPADLEEHRQRLWPGSKLARCCLQSNEPKLAVKADGFGFCIDHNAKATHLRGHVVGEREYRAQQRLPDTLSLRS